MLKATVVCVIVLPIKGLARNSEKKRTNKSCNKGFCGFQTLGLCGETLNKTAIVSFENFEKL